MGDVSSLLNPDTPLGELASLFDPNAVTDIASLLSASSSKRSSRRAVLAGRTPAGRTPGDYIATTAQAPRIVVETKLAALARWLSVGV